MTKGDWWFKFEIHTWLNDPQLRRLARENRDSWLTTCLMMRLEGVGQLSGEPSELANLLHLTADEFAGYVADLVRTKTADVTQTAKKVTIKSRRYTRELKVKTSNRLRKQKERSHADVTPESQDRVISKELEIEIREEKESAIADKKPRATRVKKTLCEIPADFALTDEMREWAKAEVPSLDIEAETKIFIDRCKGKGTEYKDWVAGWRTQMQNAVKWAKDKPKESQATSGNYDPKKDMLSPHYVSPAWEPSFDTLVDIAEIEAERRGEQLTRAVYDAAATDYLERHPDRQGEIETYEHTRQFREKYGEAGQDASSPSAPTGRGNGVSGAQAAMPVPR